MLPADKCRQLVVRGLRFLVGRSPTLSWRKSPATLMDGPTSAAFRVALAALPIRDPRSGLVYEEADP
jgi:hypothetical protein